MNGSDSLTERFILEMEKKIVNGEYKINTMLPSFVNCVMSIMCQGVL